MEVGVEKISAEMFDVLPGSNAKMIAIKKSVDALRPGRYDRLPLACRIFAENVLRRCPPAQQASALTQIVEQPDQVFLVQQPGTQFHGAGV